MNPPQHAGKQWFHHRGLRFEEVSSIFCVKGALILDETCGPAGNKSTSPSFLTDVFFFWRQNGTPRSCPPHRSINSKGSLTGSWAVLSGSLSPCRTTHAARRTH